MKKLLALAAVSAALFAAPASAQLYAGGGIGESRPDHGDHSWKAFGGIQLTPFLGGEVSYHDFGESAAAEFDAWSLAGTGTVALDDNWSVLGKVGVARLSGATSDETNLLLGAGVGLALNKNFGLRLEYEDFGKIAQFTPENSKRTRNLGISLRYLF